MHATQNSLQYGKQRTDSGAVWTGSGGGFGAEDALEARAGELDAYKLLAGGPGISNVDDAALGGEVGLVDSDAGKAVSVRGGPEPFGAGATRRVLRKRDADFEVRADGDVETRQEGGAVAAKIFAGSIFLEGYTAGIATAYFERQADSYSTFRALPRNGGARERDHGLGPLFW